MCQNMYIKLNLSQFQGFDRVEARWWKQTELPSNHFGQLRGLRWPHFSTSAAHQSKAHTLRFARTKSGHFWTQVIFLSFELVWVELWNTPENICLTNLVCTSFPQDNCLVCYYLRICKVFQIFSNFLIWV